MTLLSILNDLSVLCEQTTGNKCNISLILPKDALEALTKQARLKERIRLFGEMNPDPGPIRTVHGTGGTISLYGDDQATILKFSLKTEVPNV